MTRTTLLLAFAILALPACASETTGADVSVAGTYSLKTVDGQPLPRTAGGEVLTAGSLVLKADNTWSVLFTQHLVSGGDTSSSEHGNYTVSKDILTLHDASVVGLKTLGIITGSIITIKDDEAHIYVFTKS